MKFVLKSIIYFVSDSVLTVIATKICLYFDLTYANRDSNVRESRIIKKTIVLENSAQCHFYSFVKNKKMPDILILMSLNKTTLWCAKFTLIHSSESVPLFQILNKILTQQNV